MSDHVSSPTPWAAWTAAWVRFWFPTTAAVPLAVCRLVLVPAWLLIFAASPDDYAVALTYDPVRIDQALIRAILAFVPLDIFHTREFLHGVWLVATAAGVLATVGFFTRTALLTLGLGYCILIAHLYSYGELHHPEALYCVALVLLGLSPSGRCYSVDSWIGRRSGRPGRWGPDARMDTATWALRLIQCLLGLAYFSSGSAKLLDGGLAWMNGATLQTIVLTDYVRFGMPAGLWLLQSFWLCVAGAVMTTLVEVFFFVAVFVTGARKYLLPAGAALLRHDGRTVLHVGRALCGVRRFRGASAPGPPHRARERARDRVVHRCRNLPTGRVRRRGHRRHPCCGWRWPASCSSSCWPWSGRAGGAYPWTRAPGRGAAMRAPGCWPRRLLQWSTTGCCATRRPSAPCAPSGACTAIC